MRALFIGAFLNSPFSSAPFQRRPYYSKPSSCTLDFEEAHVLLAHLLVLHVSCKIIRVACSCMLNKIKRLQNGLTFTGKLLLALCFGIFVLSCYLSWMYMYI